MNNTLRFVLMIALTLFAAACSVTRPAASISRVPATFEYSPPSRVPAGAANTTIALVQAHITGIANLYYSYTPPFDQMNLSLKNDFEALLLARGFTIRGPFNGSTELLYGDRTSSDLILEMQVEINPQSNRKFQTSSTSMGSFFVHGMTSSPQYKMAGDIAFTGNVILIASSPQLGINVWKKVIPLAPVDVDYSSQEKYGSMPNLGEELKQDNGLYNAVSRTLEKYYAEALSAAWLQIAPAEMKEVAAQAKKADRKN